MSTNFDEQYQRFEFSERWQVFRYDGEASGYFQIKKSIPHTKSVDFLGVFDQREWYMIEVKDFRGHRILNQHRLTKGELAEEVAQKVRDTLAGVVAGCRANNSSVSWSVCRSLVSPKINVRVVLWLEDDQGVNLPQWKQQLSTQTQLIKQKLHWLQVKIFVVSQKTYDNCPPGLKVSNLPGACGTKQ